MKLTKERLVTLIMICITFIGITISGIIYKQPIYRIIPLYITLGVAALQSKANRYASIIGCFNSIFYAVVYFAIKLYATAAYWALVAFPIQLITFFRWKKNAYKHSTIFRKMTLKQGLITTAAFIVAYIISYFFLSNSNSAFKFLDIASSLTGILYFIFTYMAFKETPYIWLLNVIITIIMNAFTLPEHPGQITFMISYCYLFFCAMRAFKHVNQLYREQQSLASAQD